MKAVILAGGLGTRLQSVVSAVPKPMAPVNNRPFIRHLTDELLRQNCEKIIISAHHKAEVLQEEFANDEAIVVSMEAVKLGTGGAIFYNLLSMTDEDVIFLNGDTICEVDFGRLMRQHKAGGALVTLCTAHVPNASRYGNIEENNGFVTSFTEKNATARAGTINAGVYAVNRRLLAVFKEECELAKNNVAFSFESEILGKLVANKGLTQQIATFSVDGEFLDIGIPEDYKKAGALLAAATRRNREYRPWGFYDELYNFDYKIKRIVVYPMSRLSLQYHSKRQEVWTIVRGTATVTINDETVQMAHGQSVLIPLLAPHRLANEGKTQNIEVIEVQIGSYFGEDDIIRVEDDWGRT